MPQALSVWFAYILTFLSREKTEKNIQGSILFHNSPGATHWQDCGRQRMLITHWGFVSRMFRQRVFSAHIHTLNELKTKKNPLIDTQKAMSKSAQVSDSCIVPQLAVAEGDCKFGLRRDDSVFYCKTRNPLASVYALSSRMESIKEWEWERFWVPAGRIRTKAPLCTSNGSDWALGLHRRQGSKGLLTATQVMLTVYAKRLHDVYFLCLRNS